MTSLRQHLAEIYAPAVLRQLLDLLDAATGLQEQENGDPTVPAAWPAKPIPGTDQAAGAMAAEQNPPRPAIEGPYGWQPLLHAIAPGIALAACGALVLSWLAQEVDRRLFAGWGWSSGVVIVLLLGLLQALAIGPLRGLRQHWSLNDQQAIQPRHAWRWIGASWIHVNGLEAGLNLILLLILLGASPLPLGQVILRYGLTALACLIPAAVLAQRFGVRRRWSGAAGAISALIALAAGLSLLHWRSLTFDTPLFPIPAWVLLLVVGALQLSWQLPRQAGERTSRPWQRLLCSSWTWGLVFGFGWALVSRVRELL
jgi:membrane associated rhomboid family serine protease